jgi:hypothetical protein
MAILEKAVSLDLDPHEFTRPEEGLESGGVPKAGATHIANHPAFGSRQAGIGPRSVEDVQVLIIVGAGGRTHSFLEMNLVTALQGGYSLPLFEGNAGEFARRCFVKDTPRPTYALRNAVPKSVSERPQSFQQ